MVMLKDEDYLTGDMISKDNNKIMMGREGSLAASYYCSKSCIGQRTIEVHRIELLKGDDEK